MLQLIVKRLLKNIIDGCDADMPDKNNSKVLSQKICKCGNAIADLLDRIDGFSENLGRVKFGESPYVLKAYEESVNYVYGDITNVESFCNIDAREEQQHSMNMFNKVSEMTTITNLIMFRLRRNEALNDLSKIRSGIKEKIRRCSI